MKRNKLQSVVIAFAGVLALASCANDDNQENSPRAIQFTGGIGEQAVATPQGRASEATWNTDDAIGIFMVDHGQTSIAENAVNKQFTTGGNGTFTPVRGDEIYFPVDGTHKVDFIAYYPYKAGVVLDGNIEVNTVDQAKQAAFDLLWAKANNDGAGYNKETPVTIPLAFEHKLAKLTMNCKAAANVGISSLNGMTVVVKGMKTKTSFTVKDGTLGTPETKADMIARKITTAETYLASHDAIILPCSDSSGEATVEFTVNNETYTWNVGEVEFTAGNAYVYEVILSRTGVKVTGTIEPWKTIPKEYPVYAE